MKTMTKPLARRTLAGLAAGAMALTAASPAAAQDRYRDRDDDRISAGEVIAGAVVLGGLAAIIAASDDNDRYDRNDRNYRQDRSDRDRDYGDRGHRGYSNGYDGYGRHSGRRAVEQCVAAAERAAQRYSGSRAEVYEIHDVERDRRGYEIEGRIAVRNSYRGRGYRDDYRRGYRNNGWDEGRFECEYRNGRVIDVDFNGLRGL